MNELKTFKNPLFGSVRALIVEGEPWFPGKDVARVLGYKDTSGAIRDHVDVDDKKLFKPGEMPTLRVPNYGMMFINESGLYSMIFSSKLDKAREFKHWVTSEVLPSIRKNGGYSVKGNTSPISSLNGLANLINITRKIMIAQGSSSHKIAIMAETLCYQFGVALPDNFVEPSYEQVALQGKQSPVELLG